MHSLLSCQLNKKGVRSKLFVRVYSARPGYGGPSNNRENNPFKLYYVLGLQFSYNYAGGFGGFFRGGQTYVAYPVKPLDVLELWPNWLRQSFVERKIASSNLVSSALGYIVENLFVFTPN